MKKVTLRIYVLIQLAIIVSVSSSSSQLYSVDAIKGPVCVVRDSVTGKTVTVSPEISKFNVIVTDGIASLLMAHGLDTENMLLK